MVLSLGQLTLKTVDRIERRDVAAMYAASLTAEQVMDEVRSQAYDKFQLDIQNVQVLVAVAGENWKACLSHDRVTQMHIVEPIGLHVAIDMCVVDDDPQLPKMRISAKVPRIGISIADDRTLCAVSLVRSIPLPESSDRIEPGALAKAKSFMASSMSRSRFAGDGAQRAAKTPAPDAFNATAPLSDPSAEMVQFTDLELSFVMNELCINLYRVSEVADQSPATQSYRTPPEEFVSTSESSDQLQFPNAPHHPRPSLASVDLSGGRHLSMRVRQLEFSMVQRTYDLKVALKLGAIGLNQIRPDDLVLSDLAIIETPTYADCTGYLFTCQYTAASKTVPEFATRYKSVEQLVEINFSVLIMRLHQERIAELMQLAHDLQQSYEQIARQPPPADASPRAGAHTATAAAHPRDRVAFAGDRPLAAVVEKAAGAVRHRQQLTAVAATVWTAHRAQRATVVDSIQLKVVANMERVAIVLECYRKRIAELKIEKLRADLTVKKSYTDVALRLQDIVITDPNPRSIHPTILSVIGGNALACQVVVYDMKETANYNQDNMRIDVSMGCAKIVFLNWFVSSVLQFMDNFQVAQRAIADAGTAAAEQAKQNMVHAYENAQRLRLNIHIKAPIILVPMDSQSRDAIAIDFGNLAITNVCSEIASSQQHEHGPAILDETKLELKDLKLSRVYIEVDQLAAPEQSSAGRTAGARLAGLRSSVDILSPTTFATLIRRNLSAGWYRQIPDIEISARLKRIEVWCTFRSEYVSKNLTSLSALCR